MVALANLGHPPPLPFSYFFFDSPYLGASKTRAI